MARLKEVMDDELARAANTALIQQEVKRVFEISMGRTPLRLLIRKMEFRLKVPRPKHYKTNPAAQEAFKKKLLTGRKFL